MLVRIVGSASQPAGIGSTYRAMICQKVTPRPWPARHDRSGVSSRRRRLRRAASPALQALVIQNAAWSLCYQITVGTDRVGEGLEENGAGLSEGQSA